MNNIVDVFLKLEPLERFTVTGIFLTLLISLGNLIFTIRNNKKNIYVNTILKERIESLTKLKDSSAKFMSLVMNYRNKDFINNLTEINYLSNIISFQLNRSKSDENEINEKLVELMYMLNNYKHDENSIKESININNIITFLKEKLSIHIKNEWEKVKKL